MKLRSGLAAAASRINPTRRLRTIYATGPILLVLDDVTTHDAKAVRAWLKANSRVHILWLPKSAPHEANPVEQIWGLIKAKVAANQLCGNIGELADTARRLFTELAPHPVQLPDMTAPAPEAALGSFPEIALPAVQPLQAA